MKSVQISISSLLLLCLNGCQPSIEQARPEGLVYCAEGAPETFNPQLVTSGTTIDAISQHLYDRLLDIDPTDGKLLPGLALSWSVSADGLTYRFVLRTDVHFHQTSYFTPSRLLSPADVEFTFNRMLDHQHPYYRASVEYPYFDSVGWQDLVKHVKAVSADTIEFQLNQPDSSFLSVLATDFAAILSAEYGEQLIKAGQPNLLDSQPIGTGPFIFANYSKNQLIRYRQNQQYWRQQVHLPQLVIDIVPDNRKRLAKLLTQECDIAPLPRLAELKMLAQRPGFVVTEQTSMNVGYWAFNTQKPPFNQIKVRQALALAVDKQHMLQAVYFNQAEIAHSVLPPNSWAYDSQLPTTSFDLVKAKQLLSEAGYPNGFQMDIWAMPVQRTYNPNAQKMAELLQADLAKIGVKAKIVSFEWNAFRRKLRDGEHDSVLIGWSADNADPDNFFRPLLSCAAAISGGNRANWCNESFDQLIGSALLTTEQQQRRSYYLAAQQFLQQEMPLVPIAHSKKFQVQNIQVQNISINPYGGINFASTTKSPRSPISGANR